MPNRLTLALRSKSDSDTVRATAAEDTASVGAAACASPSTYYIAHAWAGEHDASPRPPLRFSKAPVPTPVPVSRASALAAAAATRPLPPLPPPLPLPPLRSPGSEAAGDARPSVPAGWAPVYMHGHEAPRHGSSPQLISSGANRSSHGSPHLTGTHQSPNTSPHFPETHQSSSSPTSPARRQQAPPLRASPPQGSVAIHASSTPASRQHPHVNANGNVNSGLGLMRVLASPLSSPLSSPLTSPLASPLASPALPPPLLRASSSTALQPGAKISAGNGTVATRADRSPLIGSPLAGSPVAGSPLATWSPIGPQSPTAWPVPASAMRPDRFGVPIPPKNLQHEKRPAPPIRAHTIAIPPPVVASPGSGPKSPNAPSELCKAAADGELAAVGSMLEAGYAVGAADAAGWTALHKAVQQGHEPVVRLLLARGASAGQAGPSGLRPLHVAIMAHDASIARILLEHGASPETGHSGATPLHLAVSRGSEDVVRALLGMGADAKAMVTAESGRGETAVHMAVAAWHDELLPLLLWYGIDVNTAGQNPEGQTALHIASWYGYESAARTLLDAGAFVDMRYADGRTALHAAAQYGHTNILDLLLNRGADLMAVDSNGRTALDVAVSCEKTHAAEFLVDCMAQRMGPLQKTWALISAAGAGQLALIQLLVRKGFPVDGHRDGVTALDLAAQSGHESVVLYLLSQGANPLPSPTHMRPSAVWAAECGHTHIVGLLDGKIPRNTRGAAALATKAISDNRESTTWTTATDNTPREKRRTVKADPTPGGFAPKCHVCLDLDFRRGAPKAAEVQHVVLQDSVAAGAARKCPGCAMILKCLGRLGSTHGVAAWSTAEAQCELRSLVHGGPLYVTCGTGASQSSVRAEIYSLPGMFHLNRTGHGSYLIGRPTAWPVVGPARHVPAAWCAERMNLARTLVEECSRRHQTCAYTEGVLPRRVIDVGSDAREPHLYLTDGETGRYATLSHCWGGSSSITTTTATIAERTTRIPLATLPKTFREAVLTTRGLGVRYLWIDSLCILQDSADDWEEETGTMSRIYAGSYVNLSAAASPDCHGGIFPATSSHSFSWGVTGPGGRKTHVYFRLTNLLEDERGEVCHRLYDARSGGESWKSALDRRAWALQECLLAPRQLHFGSSEIAFACTSRRACECQIVSTATDLAARPKAEDGVWTDVVEEFTHRQLTHPRDRLAALAGLAQHIAQHTGGEYVVGLWRAGLLGYLLWRPDYACLHGPQGHLEPDVPRRPAGAAFHAPSWSWASIDGPVSYDLLVGARASFATRASTLWTRPPSGSTQQQTQQWTQTSAVQVVDVHIVAGRRGSRDTHAAHPRSASLTLRGPVAAARLASKAKRFPMHGSPNGGLLRALAGAGPPGLQRDGSADLEADFEPDVRDAHAELKVGEEVALLFFAWGASGERERDGGATHEGAGAGSTASASARSIGLVLKRQKDNALHAEPTFRRIGTFVVQREGGRGSESRGLLGRGRGHEHEHGLENGLENGQGRAQQRRHPWMQVAVQRTVRVV